MCDKYMTKTNISKVVQTNACKDDELQKKKNVSWLFGNFPRTSLKALPYPILNAKYIQYELSPQGF